MWPSYLQSPYDHETIASREYAFNKQHSLNSGVHLITRVYSIKHKFAVPVRACKLMNDSDNDIVLGCLYPDDFCDEIEVEEQDHMKVHTLPDVMVGIYWQITVSVTMFYHMHVTFLCTVFVCRQTQFNTLPPLHLLLIA